MSERAITSAADAIQPIRDPLLGIRWTWENVQRAVALARWLSLGLGVLILLDYTKEIGQFPEGISLGEGLAFYMVVVAFALSYLVYAVAMIAIGGVLARSLLWVAQRVLEWRARNREKARPSSLFYKRDHSVICPWWMLGLFPFGVILMWLLGRAGWQSWAWQLGVIAIDTMYLIVYAIAVREQALDEARIVVMRAKGRSDARETHVMRILSVVVLIGFPLLAVNQLQLVDMAFELAQFRKEHAVVDVRVPYDKLLSVRGAKPTESDLGPDYKRFVQVDVLLKSLGERITLRVCDEPKRKRCVLSLPKDAVFVE